MKFKKAATETFSVSEAFGENFLSIIHVFE
jgi:hypothetical protein